MTSLTEKEIKVLAYFFGENFDYRNPIHGTLCKRIIFDEETVKKYSFARTRKIVIETMTLSYLGKMRSKGLLESSYGRIENYAFYTGHYITEKGKKAFLDYLENN